MASNKLTRAEQAGIRRRSEWLDRNPELAADYLRLPARDRAEVDELFVNKQGRKASAKVTELHQAAQVVGRANRAVAKAKKARAINPDARANLRTTQLERGRGRHVSGLDNAADEHKFWILYTQGLV